MKKLYRNLSVILLIMTVFAINISCKRNLENKFQIMNLDNGWEFRKLGDSNWYPAQVPGTVHTDLLTNGLIEDPYYRDNENKMQWISHETWQYRLNFDLSEDFLNKYHHLIKFEGLDTYSEVQLNGSTLAKTDNMFRTWILSTGKLLKKKNNVLEITFFPSIKQDSIKASKVGYLLPDIRAYSRKAPYQYGWDWGPRLVTCGIWRPVTLECWDGTQLENWQLVQKSVSQEKAELEFIFNIYSSGTDENFVYPFDLELNLTHDNFSKTIDKSISLQNQQENQIKIPVTIDKPALWWCNGMGKPNLYGLEIKITQKNNIYVQQKGHFGIRTIELVRDDDSIGQSFYFKINGIPVFTKGANYIPQDNFIPRLTPEKQERLIKTAADANMNMLRIWGGGTYESNEFYDLCDKYGIMVWQDFMFACNMYPGDEAFLKNVNHEAEDNIIRLRNHPSLALWCGNNEIDEGWHNWGWQKSLGYSKEDSIEIWQSYQNIFHKILPETISRLDADRPYHPSSPTIGWGHEESRLIGDSHYWGVWWGEEPFEIYRERVGRFMSEYGFQGMPPMQTIEKFTLPEDRKIGSPVMEVHQKHPRGTFLINTYMERDFPVPPNFEDYIYVSQLVQAEGINTALEAHRRGMPHCMGTLYWQLNDCWPVTSWSSVDYYGNWKALHYFAKRAFEKTILSTVIEKDTVLVYLISDEWKDFDAKLTMKLIDFEGIKLWDKQIVVKNKPGFSQVIFKITVKELLKKADARKVVFVTELSDNEGIITRNQLYFDKPKNLDLPVVEPEIAIEKVDTGYELTLSSSKLIKNLYLEYPGIEGHFSDNFFDLLPGEKKAVFFETSAIIPENKSKPAFKLLNQLMRF